jgi:hypothetical protein
MPEKNPRRQEPQARADTALISLRQATPEYTVDDDQPDCRGGTNFITFGTLHGQPVVYKYFDYLPRKTQEEKALRLYAPSGLVPRLYPADTKSMLVMERLLGSTLTEAQNNFTQDRVEGLYYQIGRSIARFVDMAPGATSVGRDDLSARPGFDYEFYCQASVCALFDTVMQRAARVLRDEDVPDADILRASLASLQQHRDEILSYRSFIQMDDFHSHNIIVDGSNLRGFIDLEMTRYGNEVLLLAAAVVMTLDRPALWVSLRRGYEDCRGRPIDPQTMSLATIAAPFSQWIRFIWYWTTDPKFLEEGLATRGWPIRDIKARFLKLQKPEP